MSETLVVYISGTPTGTKLSAGTLSSNVWTLQPNQLSGLQLTPSLHSDVDFTLSVTSLTSEDDGTSSIFTTSDLAVRVSAIADTASLQTTSASTLEDQSVNLVISTSVIDTDGSETLVVYISGTPTGAKLSAGTVSSLGIWTLQAGDLSGLQVTPSLHSDQDFTLSVTSLTSEDDGTSSTFSTADLAVTVSGVADSAKLQTSSASTLEDQSVNLVISSTMVDTDGSETLVVYISGTPTGAKLSAGTVSSLGIWTLQAGDLSGLQLAPTPHSDVEFTLSVTSLTSEDDGTSSTFITSSLAVTIGSVIDTASLQTISASTLEDQTVNLVISTSLVDTDGSETLVVYISGTPTGVKLSAGTLSSLGIWTLQAGDLSGLQLTPLVHSDADFTLSVTALTSEGDGSSSVFTTSSLAVTVSGVADTPSLQRVVASGVEDTGINISISSAIQDTDGSETLVVYIGNLPTGTKLSTGTVSSLGVWTILSNELSGLQVMPTAHSDADFTLTITALTSEDDGTSSTFSTADLAVTVSAIADSAKLQTISASTLEDQSVNLVISTSVIDTDGSETLVVYISGTPTGAKLSAGTVSSLGIWTLQAGDLSGLQVTPSLHLDVDFTLSVTSLTSEDDGTSSIFTTSDLAVRVSAIADTASLQTSSASTLEDQSVNLVISTSVIDTDGSETLVVYISGTPTGAKLSAGTVSSLGIWTLQAGDLSGLQVTPSLHSDQDFTLSVTSLTSEDDGTSSTFSTADLAVTVSGVADSAKLQTSSASTLEDQSVNLVISSTMVDTDGSETLVVYISGTPTGAKLSAGTVSSLGIWTLQAGDLSGLQLAPTPHSDVEFTLSVTSLTSEDDGTSSTFITSSLAVTIGSVIDTASLQTISASTLEDQTVNLVISTSLVDTDGSETLVVYISGTPTGAKLSAGTLSSLGIWTLQAGDLSGLQLTPSVHSDADFTLSVTALTSEGDGSSSVFTTSSLAVTVSGVADTPSLQRVVASGVEDTGINISISSAIQDTDGSETLVVYIGNLPTGTKLSTGTVSSLGVWTILSNELSGLQVMPTAHSDADFTLTITALTSEDDGTSSTFSTADLAVTVSGVADSAKLQTISASTLEDQSVNLVISTSVIDTDGSETLVVYISGTPTGAKLSAGTVSSLGIWTLQAVDLSGLQVTPSLHLDAEFTLTITSLTSEDDGTSSTFITSSLAVTVSGVADSAKLQTSSASTLEDQSVNLVISTSVIDTDGSETLVVYISGAPTGAKLSAGTVSSLGIWTLQAGDLSGLQVTPSLHSDQDFTLSVTSLTSEDDGTSSTFSTADLAVTVSAIADSAKLQTSSASTLEDQSVNLVISSTMVDTDGSETLVVYISGTPTGAKLSAGTLSSLGIWTLQAGDLSGLQLAPTPHSDVEFTLSVTSLTSEDDGTSSTFITSSLAVTIGSVIDTASLQTISASTLEDQAVNLVISTSLVDTDGSETLVVYISGTPTGAKLSAGTLSSLGIWTLQAGDLSGLQLTPSVHSDADFTLSVTALTSEGDGSSSVFTTSSLAVTVSGVADTPSLQRVVASGVEDTGINISISSAIQDTDGSETLVVYIGNLPTGAKLSTGTVSSLGVWTILSNELSGLQVMPTAHSDADFTLTITALISEDDGTSSTFSTADLAVTVSGVADSAKLQTISASTLEDQSANLVISTSVIDTDGSETLVVYISGTPTGAKLSAGTVSSLGIWTLQAVDLSGLQVTPSLHLDAEFTLTITSLTSEDDGTSSTFITSSLAVTVSGVADSAKLQTSSASTLEDQSVNLVISTSVIDTDGSETLVVYISGAPTGAKLSAGTVSSLGIWTLQAVDLSGLQVTPSLHSDQDFTLSVTSLTSEDDGTSSTFSTADLAVTVSAIADSAKLQTSSASTLEDQSVNLVISTSVIDTDGSETLVVYISGTPTGAKLSAGTVSSLGIWTLQAGDLSGLQLAPTPHSDVEFTLSVTSLTSEDDGTSSTFITSSLAVTIGSVIDTASLQTISASTLEDQAVNLVISTSLVDTDGSETLVVYISGTPTGAKLSAGTLSSLGIWTLQAGDLSGLQLTPSVHSDADFTLSVTALTSEGDGSSSVFTTSSLAVTVSGVADTPSLQRVVASGVEDTGINISISSAIQDTDGSETLVVYIGNLPTGTKLSTGTVSSLGVWTILSNELSGLQVMPTAHSDADFTLTITALTSEDDGTSSTFSTADLAVTVSAIADSAKLQTISASTLEDQSVNLVISTSVIDTDGSETLVVYISGTPTGAKLSAGTVSSGVWTLQTGQLSGLQVTPPAHSDGEFTLSITSLTSEDDGASSIFTTSSLAVTIGAVIDTASLQTISASTLEDQSVNLVISTSVNDSDGSETLVVYISGTPTGAKLSAGTVSSLGIWTLQSGDLSGLQVTPTPHSDQDFTLSVTSLTSEDDGTSSTFITSSLTVSVSGVVDSAKLQTISTSTLEDLAVDLMISTSVIDTDGSETLVVYISGTPTGAKLSAGTLSSLGIWTLQSSQLSGLQVTPGPHGDFTLSVTALTSEDSGPSTVQISSLGVAVTETLQPATFLNLAVSGTSIAVSAVDSSFNLRSDLVNSVAQIANSYFAGGSSNGWNTLAGGQTQLGGTAVQVLSHAAANVPGGDVNSYVLDTANAGYQGIRVDAPGLSGNTQYVLKIRVANQLDALGNILTTGQYLNIHRTGGTVIVGPTAASSANISSSDLSTDGSFQAFLFTFTSGPNLLGGTPTQQFFDFALADSQGGRLIGVGAHGLLIDSFEIVTPGNVAGMNLFDTDGSETNYAVISNVPSNVTLTSIPSGGTLSSATLVSGKWTISAGLFDRLQFDKASKTTTSDFTMSITSIARDISTTTTKIGDIRSVTIDTGAQPASIDVETASGIEDVGNIALSVSIGNLDTDGSETLLIYVSGAPTGSTLSAGTSLSNVWTLSQAQLSGLKITPAAHADSFTLSVTALTSESNGGIAITTSPLTVAIPGSADTAKLQTSSASTLEDQTINLVISTSVIDTDGSETLVVYISGMPTGAKLSAGTVSSGVWTLQTAQLSGLQVTPPAHSDGEFTLSVTSLTSERDGASSIFTTSSLAVTIGAVIDTASLQTISASTLEDQSVNLVISTSLDDSDGSETLVIYISGAPTGAKLSAGTVSSGVWTLQSGDLSGLQVTPTPHSDQDFTLSVTSLTSEDDGTSSTFITSSLAVSVLGVVDSAKLQTISTSTLEDLAVDLAISTSVIDTDGSETLVVYISGTPTGAKLSAGTISSLGIWTLQSSQLSGLQVTPGPHGDFTLSVTALTSEDSGPSTVRISSLGVAVTETLQPATFLNLAVSGTSIAVSAVDSSFNLRSDLVNPLAKISSSYFAGGSSNGWSVVGGTGGGSVPEILTHGAVNVPGGSNDRYVLDLANTGYQNIKVDTPGLASGTNYVLKIRVANQLDVLGNALTNNQTLRLRSQGSATSLTVGSSVLPTDGSFQTFLMTFTTNVSTSPQYLQFDTLNSTSNLAFTNMGKFGLLIDSFEIVTPGNVAGMNLFDTDGSETNYAVISNVPSNVTLTSIPSGGTLSSATLVSGKWTVSAGLFDRIQFDKVSKTTTSDFTMSITSIARDISTTTTKIGDIRSVTIDTGAQPASIDVETASGIEDVGNIALSVSIGNLDTDGSETLLIYVSGAPTGSTLSAGTSLSNVWTLSQAQLTGLKITPAAHADSFTLSVTALTSESNGGIAITTSPLTVAIPGSADTAKLQTSSASTLEDQTVNLVISTSVIDTDGSETLLVYISGMPTGAKLSAGTVSSGVWTLQTGQLSGLQVTPPAHSDVEFTLSITSLTSERDGASSIFTTSSLAVTIGAVIDTASLQTISASTLEDQSVNLVISTSVNDSDGSETLVVYISGTPTGAKLSAGTVSSLGIWTLQSGDLSGLQVTPTPHSDQDFTLSVTSLTSEDDGTSSTFITSSLAVSVLGVVDSAKLQTISTSTLEDLAVDLMISTSVIDTDGSETLVVYISGTPTGAKLSAGTLSSLGIWTLQSSQLSGLQVTPGPHGDFTLSVTALISEDSGPSTVQISSLGVAVTETLQPATFLNLAVSGTSIAVSAVDSSFNLRSDLVNSVAQIANSYFAGGSSNGWNTLAGGQTQLGGTAVQVLSHAAANVPGGDVNSYVLDTANAGYQGIRVDAPGLSGNTQYVLKIRVANQLDALGNILTTGQYLNIHRTGGTVIVGPTAASLANISSSDLSTDGSFQAFLFTFTSGPNLLGGAPTQQFFDFALADSQGGRLIGVGAHGLLIDSFEIVTPGNVAGMNLFDTDGSETNYAVISNVPSNVTLSSIPSGGTLSSATLVSGKWTVSAGLFDRLQFDKVSKTTTSDFTMSITSIARDISTTTTKIGDIRSVTIDTGAQPASIDVETASGIEDVGNIALSVSIGNLDTDGSETLLIYISGAPTGSTLSAGTSLSNVWTLSQAQLTGLKITPAAHADSFTLSVTALTSESNGGIAITTSPLTVAIPGSADTAKLQTSSASTLEDQGVNLVISTSLVDSDGSETLVVYISGMPTGAKLSAGTVSSGVWTLQTGQLSGLQVTPPAHSDVDFTLSVTSLTSERDGASSIFTTSSLAVRVSGVADSAKLQTSSASTLEDQSVNLVISTSLDDSDGSETLVVYISGTPTGAKLSAGTVSSGVWTLQSGDLSGLQITPTPHSDQDFTLSVTSLTSEDDGTSSIFTTSSLAVTIGAVIDTASLQTISASTLEDQSVNLVISTSLDDSDGSETLVVYISGTPTGAKLSAGTLSSLGIWTLQSSQLSGLQVTPGPHGDFTLSVTALTSEDSGPSTVQISSLGVAVTETLQPATILGIPSVLNVNDTQSKFTFNPDHLAQSYVTATGPVGITVINGGVPNDIKSEQAAGIPGGSSTRYVFGTLNTTPSTNYYQGLRHHTANSVTLHEEYVLSVKLARPQTGGTNLAHNVWIAGGSAPVIRVLYTALPTDGGFATFTYTYTPTSIPTIDHETYRTIGTTPRAFTENNGFLISDISLHRNEDPLSVTLYDTDGSETNFFVVTGVPSNVTLSAIPSGSTLSGATLVSSKWTVAASAFDAIDFRPTGTLQDFTMQLTSVALDVSTNITKVGAIQQTVVDTGVQPASIDVETASGIEDVGNIALSVSIGNLDTDGSETLLIYVSGAPTGSTLSAGTSLSNVWTLSQAQLTGLKITPAAHADSFTLSVTALTSDSGSGIAITTSPLTVAIPGSADTAKLQTSSASTLEDQGVNLVISTSLVDSDGSETLVVYISGMPTGAKLSAGTVSSGVWTLQTGQLSGLQVTPPAHSDGEFTLSITSLTSERDGASSIFTTSSLAVSVSGVADSAKLQTSSASTLEDQSANLVISTSVNDSDGSETLVVYISGTPTGAKLSAGTVSSGVWTLQSGDLSGLQVTPTPHSDQDFTLSVTSLTSEDDGTSSTFITSSLAVSVLGVVDSAKLQTISTSTLEDLAVDLAISTSVIDTDGSETLVVYISGTPTGAKLSAGTLSSLGIWTLQSSQLSGLQVTPGPHGDFTLSVTALTSEDSGSSTVQISSLGVAVTETLQPATILGIPSVLNVNDTQSKFTFNPDHLAQSYVTATGPVGITVINGGVPNDIKSEQAAGIPGGSSTRYVFGTLNTTPSTNYYQGLRHHTANSVTLHEEYVLSVKLARPQTGGTNLAHNVWIAGGSAPVIRVLYTQLPTDGGFATFTYTYTPTSIPTIDHETYRTIGTTPRAFTENNGFLISDISLHRNEDPLSVTLYDTDGSETNFFVVTGVPSNVTLSAIPSGSTLSGATLVSSKWTVAASAFDAIDFRPTGTLQDFTMQLTSVALDVSTNITKVGAIQQTVVDTGVQPASIDVETASGIEDVGNIALSVSIGNLDTDGSETLLIYVSGAPTGSTLSAGTSLSNVWTLSQAQLTGLKITPAAHADSFTLSVTALTSDSGSGIAITTSPLTVAIPGSADTAKLQTSSASTLEDQTVNLVISTSLVDSDGSETLVVYISGMPTGAKLSAGTVSSGVWTLQTGQLSGLQVTPAAHSDGEFTLSVTSLTSERDGASSIFTTSSLAVSVSGVADSAKLQTSSASTLEDQSANLVISTSVNDSDGSETLVVYISGTPTGVKLSAGTVSSGVWTLQSGDLLGLQVTSTPHSDQDFTLSVTSLTSENDGTSSTFITSSLAVSVSGVVDSAKLQTISTSTLEDLAVDLAISTSVIDTDGSETLVVYISGTPTGAKLSAGTLSSLGIWTLQSSQLSGLQVTPGPHGDFTLSVTALTSEDSGTSTVQISSLGVAVTETLQPATILGIPSVLNVNDTQSKFTFNPDHLAQAYVTATGPVGITVITGGVPNDIKSEQAAGIPGGSSTRYVFGTLNTTSTPSTNYYQGLRHATNPVTLNEEYVLSIKLARPQTGGTNLAHNVWIAGGSAPVIRVLYTQLPTDGGFATFTYTYTPTSNPTIDHETFRTSGSPRAFTENNGFLISDISLHRNEDPLSVTLHDTDGSETNFFVVTGVPSNVTLSAIPSGSTLSGATLVSGKWTVAASAFDAIDFRPTGTLQDFTMQLTSVALDVSTNITKVGAIQQTVVDTGARLAGINIQSASGSENNLITLAISLSNIDTDGSETVSVYITGLPTNTVLSNATLIAGKWEIDQPVINNLQNITMKVANFSGAFQLGVEVVTLDLNSNATRTFGTVGAINVVDSPPSPTGVNLPTSWSLSDKQTSFSFDDFAFNGSFDGGASIGYNPYYSYSGAGRPTDEDVMTIKVDTVNALTSGNYTGADRFTNYAMSLSNMNTQRIRLTHTNDLIDGKTYIATMKVMHPGTFTYGQNLRLALSSAASGAGTSTDFSFTNPAINTWTTVIYTFIYTNGLALDLVAEPDDASGHTDGKALILDDLVISPVATADTIRYDLATTASTDTSYLVISGVPGTVSLSHGTKNGANWTVAASLFDNIDFTVSAANTADFVMSITALASRNGISNNDPNVNNISVDLSGSLENMVVEFDSAGDTADEFTLAINHHDVDEDAVIFYKISNVQSGQGFSDLYGHQYSGATSDFISEDEARQIKVELAQRGALHTLDITQYVVKTTIQDDNLAIGTGRRGGSRMLERQDFTFDAAQAYKAYQDGKISQLQNAYQLKVDGRYYELDLGAASIASANALASRIELAIAADTTLAKLFNVSSNGSAVTLASKHIGGFLHLVEVDGNFNAPDLSVSSSVTSINTPVTNYNLTLSGPASLTSDGFASLRINNRTFVVEMKAGSTLTQARDALVKDITARGLSATNVGSTQIALALASSEGVKGSFHFIEADDNLVSAYQYDASVEQGGREFKISGANLMGSSGSDYLTGSSAGELLAGGKDDGSALISWTNLSGSNSDDVIGIYQTDPNDPTKKIGQIIYGSGDDLAQDTQFTPFGGGGTIVEDQYFVIRGGSKLGLSAGDGIQLSSGASGWDVYQSGNKLQLSGSVQLLDGSGSGSIRHSSGVVDIDITGDGVSDLRYQSSVLISDQSDVLTGGGGSDVFFFRKGDGVDSITDFDVSKGGDVLVLSGYDARDINFSVDQNGKAVITFNNSPDMIVLNNVSNVSDLENNVVDFSDKADTNNDNKLGLYELLDNVVTPVSDGQRQAGISNARIILLDEEDNNLIDVNAIDDTNAT